MIILFEGVGVQLPQTFPVSLFRPRHSDGVGDVVGANMGMIPAILRIAQAACKSKSKTARNLNPIMHWLARIHF